MIYEIFAMNNFGSITNIKYLAGMRRTNLYHEAQGLLQEALQSFHKVVKNSWLTMPTVYQVLGV